jgi:hypothetical protein
MRHTRNTLETHLLQSEANAFKPSTGTLVIAVHSRSGLPLSSPLLCPLGSKNAIGSAA